MGANVRWLEARGAFYLYAYANGTRTAKRLGPTKADKRRGERIAKEFNLKLARRQIGLDARTVTSCSKRRRTQL